MNNLAKLLVVTLATGTATAALAGDDHWGGGRKKGGDHGHDMVVAAQVIKASGITADKAIDIAKKAYEGTVLQFEMDDEHNQLLYNVELVNSDKSEIYEVEVDASNGKIVKETTERNPMSRKNIKLLAAAKAIQKAGFTVKDAIAKVNPDNTLMVKEVDYDNKLGVSYFEVEAFGETGRQKFLIDINQKSVIPGYKAKGPRHHDN